MRAAIVLLSLALVTPAARAQANGAPDGGVVSDGGAANVDGGASGSDGGAANGGGGATGGGGTAGSDGGAGSTDGGARDVRAAFDFDLSGGQHAAAPDAARLARLDRQVKLRRRLLTWHQALGFVTLAVLAAANVLGSLDYYDKYAARGSDSGQLAPYHEGVSLAAGTTFAATGILALVAPNPYPKPLRLDAALIHKIAMALACAGFVAELILGPVSAASDGKLYQRDLAVTHVVTGWATFGFMGAGVLSYVVK